MKLSLVTTPSNAQVFSDEAVIGTTPLVLEWEKGKLATLSFRLAGHAPQTRTLAPQADLMLEIELGKIPAEAKPLKVEKKAKKTAKELLDDPYGHPAEDLEKNPY